MKWELSVFVVCVTGFLCSRHKIRSLQSCSQHILLFCSLFLFADRALLDYHLNCQYIIDLKTREHLTRYFLLKLGSTKIHIGTYEP